METQTDKMILLVECIGLLGVIGFALLIVIDQLTDKEVI